jgi:hypothetical protein
MSEMNTLTNLVPVVEPTDPSLRQPLSVVIKTEPQSYSETDNNSLDNNQSMSKVNDDNNNPILNNSQIRDHKNHSVVSSGANPSLLTELRGFPLCVISTTPTTYMLKNKSTIVAPKCELTLPPKKAKLGSHHGLLSVSAQPPPPQSSSALVSHQLKTSQAVPSTGMLYDLPHHHQTPDPSSNSSPSFRVQSTGQSLKLQHSMAYLSFCFAKSTDYLCFALDFDICV